MREGEGERVRGGIQGKEREREERVRERKWEGRERETTCK